MGDIPKAGPKRARSHPTSKSPTVYNCNGGPVLAKGSSLDELINFVNLEIQKLGIWLQSNKLKSPLNNHGLPGNLEGT